MNLTLIDLIVIFILSGIANFIIAFFSEKGKNVATQQDIGKITTTVESIKTDLQIALQSKLSLMDDRKQALMGYFESYHNLIEDSLNIRTEYLDNIEKFVVMRTKITEAEIDLNKAESKIEIFAYDDELLKIIHELNIITISFSGKVSHFLIEFEGFQSQINILLKNGDYNLIKAQIENYYNQRSIKYSDYSKEKLEYYKNRNEKYLKLRELIQQKLLNRT